MATISLIIGGIDVSDYVAGVSQQMTKVYDTSNAYTTASGKEKKICKGYQTSYQIKLASVPMELKNQLKAKNRVNKVQVYYNDLTFWASLRSFTASCTTLDFWEVSFTLTASQIDSDGITLKDYKLQIHYNESDNVLEYGTAGDSIIGDIKISLNANGLPTSGICASQLSFTLDKNEDFISPDTNALVQIEGFNCPDFFITSRSYDDNTARFTCTDRSIFLDLPFDSSSLTPDDEGYVSTDDVLNVIELSCGFYGHSTTDSVILPKVLYSDIEDTTCRDALQIISDSSLGIFFVDAGENLVFQTIGGGDWETSIVPDDRTDIITGIVKGPIVGLIARNTETDITYRQGTTSDAYNCFKIESKYITEELAQQIYNIIYGLTYTEFSISKCEIQRFPRLGGKIYGTAAKDENSYILTAAEVSISCTGVYASLKAAASQESEWDYEGKLTREMNRRIEENRKYNGVSISKEGLTCEGTAGKVTMEDGGFWFYGTGQPESSATYSEGTVLSEKYGFATASGGFTEYDGIITSIKEAERVTVDTETNTVTVSFNDGHSFTYSANIKKDGKIYTVSDERSEWT